MLDVKNSRNFSRTLGALGLLAGVALWIVSSALSPAWTDDTAAYLDEVAASPAMHVISAGIFLLGSIVLLPGLLAVARLLRSRRVTVGQVGASLLAVGALVAGGLVFAIAAVESAMVNGDANRAEMVALSERGEESAAAMVGFLGALVGCFMVGITLLAVGLFTRRAVPAWSPLLIAAAIVVLFVSPGRVGSAIGMAVLLAGFAPVSHRILSLSDDQWERWEVLPERGRPRAASPEELGAAPTH